MSEALRGQIIQVLLSTRAMSEGDTADALLSLLAAQPPAQAEPFPDTEQPFPPGSRARGILLQAALLIGELSKGLEKGDPTWEDLQKFGRDFDAVMTGTGDTEQQRRDAPAFMQGDRVRAACDLYEDGSDLPPFLYAKAGDLLIVRGVHAGERCYSVAHEGVDDSWFQVSPSELVGTAIEAEGKVNRDS